MNDLKTSLWGGAQYIVDKQAASAYTTSRQHFCARREENLEERSN